MTDASNSVVDNVEAHRFELVENGLMAFADYHRHGDRVTIPHVEAPEALRGIRADHQKIVPICPYAVAWLKRHPEHADVLA
jgi:uncharacterized protein